MLFYLQSIWNYYFKIKYLDISSYKNIMQFVQCIQLTHSVGHLIQYIVMYN